LTDKRNPDVSLAHLAAVVQASDDAIVSHALDGTILSWNAAAERMYGYTASEAAGRSIAMLVPGGRDDVPEILERLRRGERIVQYETVRRRKDGARIDVSLTISPITDPSGAVVAASTIARDITTRKHAEDELRRLNAELEHKAYHDALTGLPNRALFADRLRQALARARRYGVRAAVFLLDVNGFKHINDTFGHAAGDAVLMEMARRLAGRVRRTDTVARWGGDEFSAVITDVRSAVDAVHAAERLLEGTRAPIAAAGRTLRVTVSLGISLFPTDGEQPDDLVRHADHAMYQAERGRTGESAFRFFGTFGERGPRGGA
jgi:diguanylate cyclase (GGDEF)-like protein/PAS domain S-box-containing protein